MKFQSTVLLLLTSATIGLGSPAKQDVNAIAANWDWCAQDIYVLHLEPVLAMERQADKLNSAIKTVTARLSRTAKIPQGLV